ncbi:3-hydroxyacyl-ACP dehydratase FabZ family protein [soil metagenome]
MPPQLLFDISRIDLNGLLLNQDAIRAINPHRGDMEQLNGVIWADGTKHQILGFKDVRDNEFWVPGHIPGRPLLPGVLMVEAAAQLASIHIKKFIGWKGFVGFGGLESCKFRQQVGPGIRLYILCAKIWERHHRICCRAQGLVNGTLAFECDIIGTEF